jgi:hypothetical protein
MAMTTDNIAFSLLAIGVGAFIVLRVIPSYINNRKREVEAELKQAEERANRAEAERKERDRKEVLQKNDSDADQILRHLICAKLDLQHILSCIDNFNVTPENIVQLWKWTQDHQGVMDFYVFREITGYFPQPNEEPFLLKKEVEQLLEEHCDAGTCLEFADEKLGIQRNYEYWDGENCGGVRCEKANGRFEDVNARFERILRRQRGAGRG